MVVLGPGGSSAVGSSVGASRGSCGGLAFSGGSSALGSSMGASWGPCEDPTALCTTESASWAGGGKAKGGGEIRGFIVFGSCWRLEEMFGSGKIGCCDGFGGFSFGNGRVCCSLW